MSSIGRSGKRGSCESRGSLRPPYSWPGLTWSNHDNTVTTYFCTPPWDMASIAVVVVVIIVVVVGIIIVIAAFVLVVVITANTMMIMHVRTFN